MSTPWPLGELRMSGPFVPTLDVDYDREKWRAEAACRGTFELMFDRDQQDAAMSLCDLCPVIDECDAYAVEFRPPAGIWAGIESKQRERDRKRQQRATQRRQ